MKNLLKGIAVLVGLLAIGFVGLTMIPHKATKYDFDTDINELVIEGNSYCSNPGYKLNCLAVKSEIHADAVERAKIIGKE